MKRTLFATVFVVIASTLAAPAFARDDGPRFAQDRLDALVAQHAEANRHIAHAAVSSKQRDQDQQRENAS